MQRWLKAEVFETLVHDLRVLLQLGAGREEPPSAAIFDSRTLQSSPESGERATYDGAKCRKGSKTHMAVDTLGYLLALHVNPVSEQDRAQVQAVTGASVTLAFVDQGYTGETAQQAAAEAGIQLEVLQLPDVKKGFVLLPRRWVVERSFGLDGSFSSFGATTSVCRIH
jgi:transposase